MHYNQMPPFEICCLDHEKFHFPKELNTLFLSFWFSSFTANSQGSLLCWTVTVKWSLYQNHYQLVLAQWCFLTKSRSRPIEVTFSVVVRVKNPIDMFCDLFVWYTDEKFQIRGGISYIMHSLTWANRKSKQKSYCYYIFLSTMSTLI